MKVKANLQGKRLGFVNGRRIRDGEIFEVSEKDYTPTWMEKIKSKPGPKPKSAPSQDLTENKSVTQDLTEKNEAG